LGLVGGVAILTKGPAVFYIGPMMAALVLHEFGLKESLKNKQIWAIAFLIFLPIIIYYFLIFGEDFIRYFNNSTVKEINEIFSPWFYNQWMNRLRSIVNVALIFFALIGMLLSKSRMRIILLGLWIGYLIYGLVFHYHFRTHDYYHIMLPFLVGLSLIPVIDLILSKIVEERAFWQISLIGLLVLAMSFGIFRASYKLYEEDFQAEADFWEMLGAEIPDDGQTAAIVPFYGLPLTYYGQQKTTFLLPENFDSFVPENYSYLLVVSNQQFDSNPSFKQSIVQNYPLFVDGGYYFIFDLQNPIVQ
jgi:4-amino-4-deoxy-L-arabinose transferase-like glycosyltransferase